MKNSRILKQHLKITNLAETFGLCIETIQMNELLEQTIFVVL